jgi:hypothetical protein
MTGNYQPRIDLFAQSRSFLRREVACHPPGAGSRPLMNNNDFVDAAVGEDQEAIGRRKEEIAHDDLLKAFNVFQKHGLALSV